MEIAAFIILYSEYISYDTMMNSDFVKDVSDFVFEPDLHKYNLYCMKMAKMRHFD